MENLNEQEHIKDPNQLDLFEGVLHTPEQERMIKEFLDRQSRTATLSEKNNKAYEQILINGGFVKDKHFRNSFKRQIITREIQLGYSWDKTNFKVELTYEDTTGYVQLIGKKFDAVNSKVTNDVIYVDFNDDKVNSSTIQGNYRYIKASSLLSKLETHNKRQETLLEEHIKKTNLKQSIVDKYAKLYPNATVTAKNEWTRYDGSFDIVEVKFASGSYVQFRLDTYKNIEYLYKKHDAETYRMNSDQLLEKFSKQAKKEDSN